MSLLLVKFRILIYFSGKLPSSTKESIDRNSTDVVSSAIQDIAAVC